jgi:hypothetical protein
MRTLSGKWWPYLVVLSIWLIFASPSLIRHKIPFPSDYLVTFFTPWSSTHGMPVKNNAMPDVISQIFPWKRLTIDTWRMGQLPLWNPYSFSGTPHAGNYQTAVFSPFNLLFFAMPELDAWTWLILLQPLLAGVFMLAFLQSEKRSRTATLLGSVAFMFCGFMTVWMAYGTLGYAAAFLPLALYGVNRAHEKKPWGYELVSIALGLSLLSGHFQISVYVVACTVFYGGYRLWKRPSLEWIRFLLYVALGISIAGPQIGASIPSFIASKRSSGVTVGEVIPWSYLTTMFAPDMYGNPVTRNDWFGHYAEWASFIGVIPLLLALFAVTVFRKERQVRFFLITAIIALLAAVPSPVNWLIYALRIPVLSSSAASRVIVLCSFSLAVLAAYGTDALRVSWQERGIRRTLTMLAWAAVSLLLLWGWLMFAKPMTPEKLSVALHNLILPTLLFAAGAFLMLGGHFVPKSWRRIAVALLLLCAAGDVLRYAAKWMPFEERADMYPKVPAMTELSARSAPGNDRIYGNLYNEAGSIYRLPLIEGYDALYQERYGNFISSAIDGTPRKLDRSVVLLDKHGKYTEQILELLGVRFFFHKLSDGRNPWVYPVWDMPNYHAIWRDEQFELFENSASLPRAFLASAYIRAASDGEAFARLFAPETDRKQSLVLSDAPSIEPSQGKGTVNIESYTPTKITFSVDTEVAKLLFLSDSYTPDWKATVDGKNVPLLRADVDFRAVAVPPGRHTVVMRYDPLAVRVGIVLSLLALSWVVGRPKKTYENRFL